MSDDKLILIQDLRQAQMCSNGSRKWFLKNNLDWSDFLVNGVHEDKFIASGDAMAMQVVEVARGRRRR